MKTRQEIKALCAILKMNKSDEFPDNELLIKVINEIKGVGDK